MYRNLVVTGEMVDVERRRYLLSLQSGMYNVVLLKKHITYLIAFKSEMYVSMEYIVLYLESL